MDAEEISRLVNEPKLSREATSMTVTITKEEEERGKKRIERVIVGRIFSKRTVNKDILRNNLPRILRSRGAMEIDIVGHNLFVISFTLGVDKRVALEEGPWHFFQDLIILKEINVMQTPAVVEFNETTMWVQCHNVPIECMEPAIIRRIGEKVGTVEDVDVGEGGHCLGRFARVKVTRGIDESLVRCIPITHEELDKTALVIIQYEKISQFCLSYGRIGHIARECEVHTGKHENTEFGYWLRAGAASGGYGKQQMRTQSTLATGSSARDRERERVSEEELVVGRKIRGGKWGGDDKREENVLSEGEGVMVDGPAHMEEEEQEREGNVREGKGRAGSKEGEREEEAGLGAKDGVQGKNKTHKTSPSKRKKRAEGGEWKRRAREVKGLRVATKGLGETSESEGGGKRKGGLEIDPEVVPKAKIGRVSLEEDCMRYEPTVEAALQPRRSQ